MLHIDFSQNQLVEKNVAVPHVSICNFAIDSYLIFLNFKGENFINVPVLSRKLPTLELSSKLPRKVSWLSHSQRRLRVFWRLTPISLSRDPFLGTQEASAESPNLILSSHPYVSPQFWVCSQFFEIFQREVLRHKGNQNNYVEMNFNFQIGPRNTDQGIYLWLHPQRSAQSQLSLDRSK